MPGGVRLRVLLPAMLLGACTAPAVAQSTGTVAGTVLDAVSKNPLESATVSVPATGQVTLTDHRGQFLLRDVPAGERTVHVRAPGYRLASQTAQVPAGRTVSLLFRVVRPAAESEPGKLPFQVERIDAEPPVPASDPAAYLRGRVPGARVMGGSGQPGEELDILLRGPRSINAIGRSQGPLIIVDGVVTTGSLADVEGWDVASVEVVKGPAAALYGSRGGNGVVQVVTKRGGGLGGDRTRYTVRSAYGVSGLAGEIDLSDLHPYAMNTAGTRFVDRFGNEFDYDETSYALWLAGNSIWSTFQDNRWPGPRYDRLDQVYGRGDRRSDYLSVRGASGATRFFLSAGTLRESGVVRFNAGYRRTTFRLNMDHEPSDRFRITGSAAYSLTDQDELEDGGGAFYDLVFMSPVVDLLRRTPAGEIVFLPDPREPRPNPLYGLQNRDISDKTSRITGRVAVRYGPVAWLDLEGSLGYDRKDWERADFLPQGYRTVTPSVINNGLLTEASAIDQALHGSVTASARRSVEGLTLDAKLGYLYEALHYELYGDPERRLDVESVPAVDELEAAEAPGFVQENVESRDYFLAAALEYADRYIVDALVRRDGSSLFGPDQRWQTYWRGGLAWRMTGEAWWPTRAVPDLELRYAVGTAGVRPQYEAQYETYEVSTGTVSLVQSGNRELRPERVTEHEVGLDAALFDRISLGLTWSKAFAEDQLDEITLPGYAGFRSQWRNIGALESRSWEASLEVSLLEARDTRWDARILFDRTRSVVTELNVPCYVWGIDRQNLGGVFRNCEGVAYGTLFGTRFATDCRDLPAGTPCEPFAVNSDGYLVYVGDYGPGDGLLQDPLDPGRVLWETTGTVSGTEYHWGAPFPATGTDARGRPTRFLPLGNVMPDFNLTFSSDFRWSGLAVFALFDASIGFDVYNQTRQAATGRGRAGELDQEPGTDAERKPVAYYQVLYDSGNVNSHFVEDGSFVKLRELALRYTLDRDRLRFLPISVDRLTISLTGRNLATWTPYTGYDPEVGWITGGRAGSALISRLDAFVYPKVRSVTAAIELVL